MWEWKHNTAETQSEAKALFFILHNSQNNKRTQLVGMQNQGPGSKE